MSGAASALRYLWVRSAANRLQSQIKRLRNPRYVFAMVAGMLYMYWALIHNSRASSGGGPFASMMASELLVPVASALLLFAAARWWLFGSDRSALAFSPAEVQFLFPAPISRRGLVHAKLVRGQLAILINTLIWTVLLRGGATTAGGWRRGIAVWLLFSTLSLHRLGSAIVRANALEHERSGRRRSIIPAVVFTGMLGAVAWGLISRYGVIEAASVQGFRAAVSAVVEALASPAPAVALWPVRALLAPVLAHTGTEWLHLVPAAVLVFALHYIWVLRLDASFEEAALEATQLRAERLQNMRSTQGTRKRSKQGKIARVPKLSLTGRPEIAIAWKNVAAAMRGGAWRMQTVIFLVALTTMAIITRLTSEKMAAIFIGLCAGWGAVLLFMGPVSMRYDLRLDLPRLAMLKTYPLSGGQLVAAEIAGVTLLHSVTIWTIMIVPVTMFVIDPGMFEDIKRMPVLLLSIAIAVPPLNTLMFTVQNAAALMFPAWVRLGTEARGFETMGQSLLTMGATTLVAAVALVFPVGVAVLVIWLGSTWLGTWSLLVGTLLASMLLLAEIWPVIGWLGSVFERTDVADVTASQ